MRAVGSITVAICSGFMQVALRCAVSGKLKICCWNFGYVSISWQKCHLCVCVQWLMRKFSETFQQALLRGKKWRQRSKAMEWQQAAVLSGHRTRRKSTMMNLSCYLSSFIRVWQHHPHLHLHQWHQMPALLMEVCQFWWPFVALHTTSLCWYIIFQSITVATTALCHFLMFS